MSNVTFLLSESLQESTSNTNSIADINHDGFPDIVLSGESHKVFIAYGNCERDGWRVEKFNLPMDENGSALVSAFYGNSIADLNSDGEVDLILDGYNSDQSYIFWGTADGFGSAFAKVVGIRAEQSCVGDIDHDGAQDILFPNYHGPSRIYWGGGINSDQTPSQWPYTEVLTYNGAVGCTISDVNADKTPDLVVSTYETGGNYSRISQVFLQTAGRTFIESNTFQTSGAYGCDAGDIDQTSDTNDLMDVVFVNGTSANGQSGDAVPHLYRQDPLGASGEVTFALQEDALGGTQWGHGITLSDFDQDGDLDLAIGSRGVIGAKTGFVQVYLWETVDGGKYVLSVTLPIAGEAFGLNSRVDEQSL